MPVSCCTQSAGDPERSKQWSRRESQSSGTATYPTPVHTNARDHPPASFSSLVNVCSLVCPRPLWCPGPGWNTLPNPLSGALGPEWDPCNP